MRTRAGVLPSPETIPPPRRRHRKKSPEHSPDTDMSSPSTSSLGPVRETPPTPAESESATFDNSSVDSVPPVSKDVTRTKYSTDSPILLTLPGSGFLSSKKCDSPLKLSSLPPGETRRSQPPLPSRSCISQQPQDEQEDLGDEAELGPGVGNPVGEMDDSLIGTRSRVGKAQRIAKNGNHRFDPVWSTEKEVEGLLASGDENDDGSMAPPKARKKKTLLKSTLKKVWEDNGAATPAAVQEEGEISKNTVSSGNGKKSHLPINLEVVVHNDPSLVLRVSYHDYSSLATQTSQAANEDDTSPPCSPSPTFARPHSITHRSDSSLFSSYLFQIPPEQHSVDVNLVSTKSRYPKITKAYLVRGCTMKVVVRSGKVTFALS